MTEDPRQAGGWGNLTRLAPASTATLVGSPLLWAVAAFVTSLAGSVTKGSCLARSWQPRAQNFAEFCYTDPPYLYVTRGLAASPAPFGGGGRFSAFEYPSVITYLTSLEAVVTHWITGAPSAGRSTMSVEELLADPAVQREATVFFWVNLVLMAACAAAVAALLAQTWGPVAGAIFAVSPVLFLSAGMNWDLLAVLLMVGSLLAWIRGRPVLTGLLLGAGTATKLFPVLVAGVVLVDVLRTRALRGAVVAGLASIVSWAALNAWPLAAHRSEWALFYGLSRTRDADVGSLWIIPALAGHPLGVSRTSLLAGLVTVTLMAGILVWAVRRPSPPAPEAVLLLLVTAFLVANKIVSPQYALWLLPLVAMTVRRAGPLLAWHVAELVAWYATFALIAGRVPAPAWVYGVVVTARIAAEVWVSMIGAREGRSARG